MVRLVEGLLSGMSLSRRQFLSAAGLAGAGAAAAGVAGPLLADAGAVATPALPPPNQSGIDHIVVVMMENRSFDHFLGWLPGADGKQAGLTFVDRYARRHHTFHQTKYSSCGYEDPDHSFEGGRIELNHGKCDGWLNAGSNDSLCISYYLAADLAFLGGAAPAWTTCDRYFAATMAETYPNRFYQHAARTDRLHNSTAIASMPTIWDRLAAAGLTGRYYFSDIPFLALWGTKYASISEHFTQFLADAAAGTLPEVSFVDPRFIDESSGTSNDDHPLADIRAGEYFLNQVYEAVTTSPNWGRTLLVINYDEWGGFFDHVAPHKAPDVSRRTALRGFRVPAVLVSPRARRGYVSHTVFDHTSVLRAIEWRWGLRALSPRDANAANILTALDFTSPPDLSAPTFNVAPVTPVPCPPASSGSSAEEAGEWGGLKKLALRQGWSLPS
jgi:phospholipase C